MQKKEKPPWWVPILVQMLLGLMIGGSIFFAFQTPPPTPQPTFQKPANVKSILLEACAKKPKEQQSKIDQQLCEGLQEKPTKP